MKNKLLKLSFGFCLVLMAVLTCGLSAVSADVATKTITFSTPEVYEVLKFATGATDTCNDETLTLTLTQAQIDKVKELKTIEIQDPSGDPQKTLAEREAVPESERVNSNFLAGIENFTNITNLSIEINTLQKLDITPIGKLEKLQNLSLNTYYTYQSSGQNMISIKDISPIANLKELKSLYIYDFVDELDLSALKNLTKLETISLSGYSLYEDRQSKIINFDAIENLTNINLIRITNTNLSDISALKKLVNLQNLYLAANNISDISSISGLLKVHRLDLSGNKITDISPIANLNQAPNLQLNLLGNKITDLSPLSNLQNLMELNLSDNNLTDISALANLEEIYELNLSHNKITDISAIESSQKLSKLAVLNLQDNEIKKFPNLKKFDYLDTLDLCYNQISDISNIKDLFSFDGKYGKEFIGIYSNKIEDISPILSIENHEDYFGKWIDYGAFGAYEEYDISQSLEIATDSKVITLPKIFNQAFEIYSNTYGKELVPTLPDGWVMSKDSNGNLIVTLPDNIADGTKGTISTRIKNNPQFVWGELSATTLEVTYSLKKDENLPSEDDEPTVTPPAEEDKPVVTPPAEEDTPVVTPPTEDDKEEELPTNTYEYLAGKNQTYIPGETIGLTFKIDADIALFEKVLVDGKELAENLYTAVSGSTVITLNDEYVKTLAEGKHTLSVQFANNKTSDTEFIIASQKVENEPGDYKENPDTGVVKQSIIISVLALVGIALCGTVAYKFKRN